MVESKGTAHLTDCVHSCCCCCCCCCGATYLIQPHALQGGLRCFRHVRADRGWRQALPTTTTTTSGSGSGSGGWAVAAAHLLLCCQVCHLHCRAVFYRGMVPLVGFHPPFPAAGAGAAAAGGMLVAQAARSCNSCTLAICCCPTQHSSCVYRPGTGRGRQDVVLWAATAAADAVAAKCPRHIRCCC
jgi:hypothetical protein